MNFPRLIGLYSEIPQQGKTCVANYLRDRYNYRIISFATPLKRMTAQFLDSMGYSSKEIAECMTTNKSERLPGIGVDTRHLMRTLGTEWGRNCIHPGVWIMAWQTQVKQTLDAGFNVVTDDIRFQNEYHALRGWHEKTEFWRVARPGTNQIHEHASEGFAENNPHVRFDFTINNDSDLMSLYEAISSKFEPVLVNQ